MTKDNLNSNYHYQLPKVIEAMTDASRMAFKLADAACNGVVTDHLITCYVNAKKHRDDMKSELELIAEKRLSYKS